jgi:hypothetical protein
LVLDNFTPCTTTTLLDCTNEWYINMDRGLYNIVVLLDLKKAFDTVNHEILLRKFERYGFGNKALDLISNKTLAKRLLELKDLQNICVFRVASRFK